MAQVIELPYQPREHQLEIHKNLKRFNVLVCHRRFGKTVLAVNEVIKAVLDNSHFNPRGAYIAPLLRQARQVAWDYLKYFTAPIPGVQFYESSLKVKIPGGREIQLFGADNPDALRGMYLDAVVLDEVAQMAPSVWTEVIRPTLIDRQGVAMFIGTPKGKNYFYELAQLAQKDDRWFYGCYKASETGIISQEELDFARESMGDDEYMQEFECSFDAGVKGAYYAHILEKSEQQGRITNIPYDPNHPVDTWWDIGMNDATAIWFSQVVRGERRFVDYYENSGEGIQFYADIVKERMAQHSCSLGVPLGPHDLAVREWGSGRSRIQTAREHGLNFMLAPKWALNDGINSVRTLLPTFAFDRDRCHYGLEALRQYRKEFDEKNQTFRTKPKHDWTSHAADALRTGCSVAERGDEETPRQEVCIKQKHGD